MYSVEVPTLEAFNELVARVDRIEAENEFFQSLLFGERWLTRKQTMSALNCRDDKLRKLTLNKTLTHRYEGKKPMYDVFSIRDYLKAQKIDSVEADRNILAARLFR